MELREHNSKLLFDEINHSYELDGKQLISCTQLLAKHNLSQSYVGADSEVLNNARIIGNMIHDEIEQYCHKGIEGNTVEFENFKNWLKQSGYVVVDSEYSVNNDIVAGRVDLLLKDTDGNYVIADIKTTSKVYIESVSWQLSIYRALDLDKNLIKKAIAIHLKDNDIEIVPIALKTDDDIEKLFDAERKGEIFKYELDNIDGVIAQVGELENYITGLDALIKKAKAQEDELKLAIINEMDARNIKSIDTETMKITRVYDSERVSYDTKAIIKDYNVDASKYEKKAFVKGGVKITIR